MSDPADPLKPSSEAYVRDLDLNDTAAALADLARANLVAGVRLGLASQGVTLAADEIMQALFIVPNDAAEGTGLDQLRDLIARKRADRVTPDA